mmetsp:Transcript_15097/g.23344  ORF Transcript_15097/g.23344 Transcript_15097/m.23344 type:complete len:207 (+) Transcript_15097:789-1409(+)
MKIVKYFTVKFTDDQSIGGLYRSKLIQDEIFSGIFDKFAKGQKLQRFDHYTREQAAKVYLKQIEEENKRKFRNPRFDPSLDANEKKKAEREKLRKQQIEMEQAAKKKEDEAVKASYLKAKEIDKAAQQKRFQLLSVKEAVSKNTMTIDRANEILYNQVRAENNKIVRAVSGKNSQKIRQFMKNIQKQNMQLDFELKDYYTKQNRKC